MSLETFQNRTKTVKTSNKLSDLYMFRNDKFLYVKPEIALCTDTKRNENLLNRGVKFAVKKSWSLKNIKKLFHIYTYRNLCLNKKTFCFLFFCFLLFLCLSSWLSSNSDLIKNLIVLFSSYLELLHPSQSWSPCVAVAVNLSPHKHN